MIREISPPPRPATLLGAVETEARKALKVAQEAIAPIVAHETPKRSGELADALRPRIARTRAGLALTVQAPRGRPHGSGATVRDVVRWVNEGTGIYREGPGPKRPIRSKRPLGRMTLPGGKKVRSVKGQHADHFMLRIQTFGTPKFEAAVERGAQAAARAAERVFR